MALTIFSTSFNDGERIPQQYTCDGRNISPPLQWLGVPENTKSFALIADDPDAPGGTWVHWVLFNIPVEITELNEGITSVPMVEGLGLHGTNDFRRPGYGGPCPPPGPDHRYFFKIYALDDALALDPGATKQELLAAMEGHLLAEGQLMGRYSR